MDPRVVPIILLMLVMPTGCSGPASQSCPAYSDPGRLSRLGVNLAGAEFGSHTADFSNNNPGSHGTDYVYPDAETIEYFSSNGLGLLRIPFRWERIQRELGDPLDPAELEQLNSTVSKAADCGARVILDLHNYARYRMHDRGKTTVMIVGAANKTGPPPVEVDDLCDVWRRLATVFRGNPAVAAYGIMNEPYDLPEDGTSWHEISRKVVDAIREVDPCTPILVSGSGWSSARRFPEVNGPKAWIDPDVPNIVYEAHLYFDHDGSGQYALDYEANLERDPDLPRSGAIAVEPFLRWCKHNGVQGFIGEFGVPPDEPWLNILDDFLRTIREADVGGCYWAAGNWWGDYSLSIQPKTGSLGTAPQMRILGRHADDGRRER